MTEQVEKMYPGLNLVGPMSECLANADTDAYPYAVKKQLTQHKTTIAYIDRHLETQDSIQNDSKMENTKNEYYRHLARLLKNPLNQRLALYIPFEDLEYAPPSFRQAYRATWYQLLTTYDVRENFNEGDTYELDARPLTGLERVVKAAHLVPWLLKFNYLAFSDLVELLKVDGYKANAKKELLISSVYDTSRLLWDWGLIDRSEAILLEMMGRKAQRRRAMPLYSSASREAWLQTRHLHNPTLLTPNANLAGPLSANLPAIEPRLTQLAKRLGPHEIVLIGGSSLKGYGRTDSDFDVWDLDTLRNDPKTAPGQPEAAHLYFNTLWLGGEQVHNLREIAKDTIDSYFGSKNLRQSLERLESDLLQYRLLHKGFSYHFPEKTSPIADYQEMDGASAFYHDDYRRIATQLFVRYVFIPT